MQRIKEILYYFPTNPSYFYLRSWWIVPFLASRFSPPFVHPISLLESSPRIEPRTSWCQFLFTGTHCHALFDYCLSILIKWTNHNEHEEGETYVLWSPRGDGTHAKSTTPCSPKDNSDKLTTRIRKIRSK